MKNRIRFPAIVLASIFALAPASAGVTDVGSDILVTFDNQGARVLGTGMSAPYRNRKRYSIAAAARRNADAVKDEYSLVEVDHWPIQSLSVYCFVFRIPPGKNRDNIIEQLRSDDRVESVQRLQEFKTGTNSAVDFDDTYANLQHGLSILNIGAAHRFSKGQGVRVAIIDSDADAQHEDLQGRFYKIELFAHADSQANTEHGTAVASVIGANANNAIGIVGVSPEARLELYVACWVGDELDIAVCDSFTLAKALDSLLENPPDILNMSITGPFDPLLARLLAAVQHAGVVVVAARQVEVTDDNLFPASLQSVIGVSNSDQRPLLSGVSLQPLQGVYAPGSQIMVALPNDNYDFRSGSSLAAAHVSGVIALLLAVSPNLPYDTVRSILRESQIARTTDIVSIDACAVLYLADNRRFCQ